MICESERRSVILIIHYGRKTIKPDHMRSESFLESIKTYRWMMQLTLVHTNSLIALLQKSCDVIHNFYSKQLIFSNFRIHQGILKSSAKDTFKACQCGEIKQTKRYGRQSELRGQNRKTASNMQKSNRATVTISN